MTKNSASVVQLLRKPPALITEALSLQRSRDTDSVSLLRLSIYAIRGGMVSDDILVNRDREGDGLKTLTIIL